MEADSIQPSLRTNEIKQSFIVGVDEVGRGPLCGDVVAAAVILPDDFNIKVQDSKKLSESQRMILANEIKQSAIAYAITSASPEEIDQLNILQATMLAMSRAVSQIRVNFELVLVDGNRCPDVNHACKAIVKGDDKVASISAASILAKVHRDQQMLEWHEKYPQYGFNKHKGYPTKQHLSNLMTYGLLPGYRNSFKPVKALLER